ncbi:hypothetical protein ACF0H5_015034 [Mactra antiquata]
MIESWMFLLLGLGTSVINADVLTIDSSHQCGRAYDIKFTESVDIHLQGGWGGTDSCEILFENDSLSDYDICVQPLSLNLDCTTVIEYQQHFVAENINDGMLTCEMNDDTSYDNHCFPYVSKFYIVFKKKNDYSSNYMFHENAHIKVYRKEDKTLGIGDSSTLWIGIFSVIPVIIAIVCVICCKIRQQKNQEQFRNAQVNYNTHVGATVQAVQAPQQQPLIPQYGYPQQPMAPGTQSTAGYTVHPTVTAYPHNQPVPAAYQPVPIPPQQTYTYPSAPTDMNAPPPSYESLMQK